MEVAEIRRRVRAAIERARAEAAARRARTDAASRAYDEFLTKQAVPLFHSLASALAGERRRFQVETPAGAVRLRSEADRADFLEIALDDGQDPPIVIGRRGLGRGRHQITSERPLRPGTAIQDLTQEDVLSFALEELQSLLER